MKKPSKPSKRKASRKPREWWLILSGSGESVYEGYRARSIALRRRRDIWSTACKVIKVIELLPKRRGAR